MTPTTGAAEPTDPAFVADPTVEVIDVSVWFGPKVALSDLSCSFGPGVTGGLIVRTSRAHELATALPRLAHQDRIRLREVRPLDDSLESLFRELVR